MKQTLRHIFLLVAMFMATASAWAADCTYEYSRTVYNTNIKNNGDVIAQYEFTNVYGLSSISYKLTLQCSAAGKDLQYKVQYLPSNSSTWTDTNISTSTLNGTWQAWRSESSESKTEAISSSSSIFNARGIRIVSNTKFGSKRTVSVSEVKFVMAKTLSGSEETMPFDDQVYNTTSSAKTRDFTFSNVATGKSISITNNTNAAEFPAEIAKNGDCTGSVTVSVKFKPSQKGTRTGQITVSGDCGSKTFTVTGNGLVATPTLTLKKTTGLVDRTTDVAKPNYIDLGDFIDTYIGDGCKYEVVSANGQYAHFDGDNFYATEQGAYTIHITSPAGDHYSDTFADGKKFREIVITVRDKARPVYKANYTQSSADGMLVDGTIENAFTLTNVSNDAYFACNISVTSISNVNNGSGEVIWYDAKNNKITARNAGTATLQFVQTENNDYYGGASPIYTFIVSKHQTSFGGEAYSMMVEGTQIANYTYSNTSSAQPTALSADDFYYTIDNVVFANEELNKGTDLITFNPSTKQITACNAGTAKITLHQKETYKYIGATASYNVTVNKYTPTFTWNSANTPYYYGTSIPNIFSTTNSDATSPVTFESSNAAFAHVENNTLYIANARETATITVTQAENYKWNKQQAVYPISPVNGSKHVPFKIDTEAKYNLFKKSISTKGSVSWSGDKVRFAQENVGFNWDDSYYDIHFEGIPDKLTFNFDADDAASGEEWFVQESSDGTNWSSKLAQSNSNNGSATITLQSSTRYLRFCYSGNLNGYISNINVTERFQFEATPAELNFGTNGINHGKQEETVTFQHANAGRITKAEITGEDAQYFGVNPMDTTSTGRDLYGTARLQVSFDNRGEKRGDTPYNAVLTIYDNAEHRIDIPLSGIRNGKSTPDFIWNPNAMPYYFNTTIANIAYSTNKDANCQLTYTSSDNTIAEVKDGDLYIYGIDKEVTITVHQTGNNDYLAHTDSFKFTPCERPSLEVPFRVSQNLHEKSMQLGTKCQWEDDAQIRMAHPTWDGFVYSDDRKRALITFAGVPDKLYFEFHSKSSTLPPTPENAIDAWIVEESPNGVDWTIAWRTSNVSTDWVASGEIDLKPNTQYIRFSYKGNFAGYIRNIIISSLEGNNFLRAEEGTYLSRGAKYGTQAVVDPFGIACRVSRFTVDNTNIYTRFQFVDNMQYLWETHDTKELFTDDKTAANTANLWQIPDASGKFTIQSGNDLGSKGQYLTISDNLLTLTSEPTQATIWHMESADEHSIVLKNYMDAAAANAAKKDFGVEINTLDKVRSNIDVQDFEVTEIAVPQVALAEQSGEYRDGINGTFDVYDNTITDLKPGFYRLTVKALYRISTSEYAQDAKSNNLESVVAYIYANDVKYPIQSVYDSHNGNSYDTSDEYFNQHYYPTQLQPSVAKAFSETGRYLNDVYVYVNADEGKTTGTLHYGIKNPSFVPGAWLAYSTITLTHFGRKEFIFEGTVENAATDWKTSGNWNRNAVPNQYHIVTIKADVNIVEPVEVFCMNIDENTHVHITEKGGLTVGPGGVYEAQENSITIDNNLQNAGFLRINPNAPSKPQKVTVNYKTKTFDNGSPRNEVWQYIGMPGDNSTISDLTGITLYSWKETEGWKRKTADQLQAIPAWEGLAFTQSKEQDAAFQITTTPIFEPEKEIKLTCTSTGTGMYGDNLFANSFLAPIDVTQIDGNDVIDPDNHLTRTFFIFNSGSWNDWNSGKGDITAGDYNQSSAGHYYSIPFHSAKMINDGETQVVIPPMQGVYVYSAGEATIKLNYQKHIMAASPASVNMNAPLRAPQAQFGNSFMRIRIQATSQNSGADRLYVIQEQNTTPEYDNGYDGDNILANGQVNIYTNEPFGQMEVSCSNNIDSMWIGFTAGEDSIYTLHFGALVGEGMYIRDISNDSLMILTDGGQYTFYAQPNSVNDMRFQLLLLELPEPTPDDTPDDTPEQGGVLTGLDNTYTSDAKIWVNNKMVYVTNAPANSNFAIYTASGMCVTAPYTIQHTPYTLNLQHLPTGVYILRLNNQAYKFVCE